MGGMEEGAASPSRSFVGRARELDELRTAFAEASFGRGRLVLVSGEAGIGKTRLGEELADHAHPDGALVVWGRSREGEGAPAFWPWVQILRSLSEAVSPASLAADLGSGAAYVAGVVPEIAERLGGVPPTQTSPESEHARFHLFDAVTRFLRKLSQTRMLLVVFDDLHWADRSSLLLLEFVAKELRDARILAVGTYREGEARANAAVAEILGGLARSGRSIPLRGLSEAEVGLLMEKSVERKPDAALVAAVHESTDGNPFFVDEIVHLLAAEGITERRPGERLPIPHGVRAAVGRRIALQPADARWLLEIASVIGREFDLALLERASGRSAGDLLGPLAAAREAGLLVRPRGRIRGYAFAHAVTRETLYDELPPPERVRLHRRVAEALENLHGADAHAHLAELAFHFFEAADDGDDAKALDYARRAGDQALGLLAYEEAAGHYQRALELSAHRRPDPRGRCELLLVLGDALWRAGESGPARDSFLRAAEIARALGAADLLAGAALALGVRAETGVVDDALVGLLESALSALGEAENALRAKLLARLAMALYFSPSAEDRRGALAAEAVAMAKRTGDRGALAFTLLCRLFVLWGPGSVEERLSLADEVIRLARAAGNLGVVLQGSTWRILSLLELGDIAAVDREIDAYGRESAKVRLPHNVWYLGLVRSARAFLVGDFVEGERLATEAAGVRGERGQHANAIMFFGAQLFTLRREQGRLVELGPALTGFAKQFKTLTVWRCSVALFHCEQGDLDAARREFDELAARDFALVLPDGNRPPALALLAEACNMLGDARRAAVLYRLLLPFEARNIIVATSALCYGPAARYLGLLAITLGRFDDADRHFADSAAMCERMGARPWAAHNERDWALMLCARDHPGDRERAAALLASALSTARTLGMKLLEEKVLSATAELASPAARTAGESATGEEASRRASAAALPSGFRREGGHWEISHAGAVFRLKDSKGLRMIAHLLRHPGKDHHAAEIVALAEGGDAGASSTADASELAAQGLRSGGLGDAGELLDARAKAAYRARLEELQPELEEAARFNDVGRAERARREIDALGEELSRAVGLAGRDRKAAAASERARLNVTRSIHRALEQIAEFSPSLHTHLAAAIRTGTFCSYQPEPGDPISFDLDG